MDVATSPKMIAYAQGGFDLREMPQRWFVLASVEFDPRRTQALIGEVASMSRSPQPDPFRRHDLTTSKAGRDAIERLLARLEGRYLLTIEDKLAFYARGFSQRLLGAVMADWPERDFAFEAEWILANAVLSRMVSSGATMDRLAGQRRESHELRPLGANSCT